MAITIQEKTGEKSETIKMVENAMTVLDLLKNSRESLGINAIAKICELTPSTTHRIVKTLEMTGWVYQLSDDSYVAGQKLSFVTSKNNFYLALRDAAKTVMEKYTAHYGMAMNLIVRDGIRCEIIEQSLTKSIINYVPPIHSVLPFYACGGGKILLCELPDRMITDILSNNTLEALTPFTITDPEEYRKILKQTAKDGYAVDFQESSINGSCIAVPIRDKEGTIIASLSFSGLIGISDPEKLLKYVPVLKLASQEITDNLFRYWDR